MHEAVSASSGDRCSGGASVLLYVHHGNPNNQNLDSELGVEQRQPQYSYGQAVSLSGCEHWPQLSSSAKPSEKHDLPDTRLLIQRTE